jgi:DNA-binding MarR family transcriptional regulator
MRMMWLLERQPATVQELADLLLASHQNTSKHVAILHQAGIVARSRDGRRVRYMLIDWTALWIVDQLAAQRDEAPA